MFGKNALAGLNQFSSEFCIFRVVLIIGRQTALYCKQIFSADLAHIAYVPNKRITVEVETQIDEVGQGVKAL